MSQGRILITGRYGFTGQYVAREMQAVGWQVWGVGLSPAPESDPCYLQANLTDQNSVSTFLEHVRPDAVIHLAGVASVDHGKVEDFYQVNVIGTRLLLEALSQAGLGQAGIVLASSANIYGNTKRCPIAEDTTPAPVNDYAVSKLSMEHVAGLFFDRLPLVLARPFNYTGRGQDVRFLVPKIVSHFQERASVIELGNLDVARDISDVRDVAVAYQNLLLNGPRGKAVNICSGHATSLKEILRICADISGHEIEVRINPHFVRANEIKTLTGDTALLSQVWPNMKSQALGETLDWMLSA